MTVLVDEQRSDLWSEVSRESVSGWSSCELDYDLSRWEPEEMESNYQQLPPSSSSSNNYGQRVYHPQADTTNLTPINHHHPLLHLLTQPIQSHTHRSRIGYDLSVKKLGTQSDQSSCVGPISSKLKILHLINRRKSDATDLYSSAVLWGPDFKGWQSSKMLTKNIKNQFGSESYFDAVLVYFNNNQGDGVIIIIRPHEMCDMRKEEFYKTEFYLDEIELINLLSSLIVIKQPAQGYHLIAILKNSLMASIQSTNYHLVFKTHVCNLINTYFQ
ncbi:hypothetical protein BY996DRAFT_6552071 [Phakopsora pachyrhizi]|nr:hypothetical protein BY996DRAFT_6552071 [Phakopsora pachyrhizi]